LKLGLGLIDGLRFPFQGSDAKVMTSKPLAPSIFINARPDRPDPALPVVSGSSDFQERPKNSPIFPALNFGASNLYKP
jgi:hypothetical protein